LTKGVGLKPASDWVLSRHGLWTHWPGTPIDVAGRSGTPFWQATWSLSLSLIELLAIGILARLWLWWRENF